MKNPKETFRKHFPEWTIENEARYMHARAIAIRVNLLEDESRSEEEKKEMVKQLKSLLDDITPNEQYKVDAMVCFNNAK